MERGCQNVSTPNLQGLREAVTLAREDRAACMVKLLAIITANGTPEALAVFAQLDGNIHELDLLMKRELELLTQGRLEA
jgi:hypothetical protein